MAVATQRDLEFVIKVRDRSRDGFAAATVSVRQLTAASKAAGQEFDTVRAKTAGLSAAVEKLKGVWTGAADVIRKVSLTAGAGMSTQSYSHFGAAMNGLTFSMINLAAKANILPPRLNKALDALNLFLNGSDSLRTSLSALAKHDNFWLRLFGKTALPVAQTAAVGSLITAFRALAGVERSLTGGGVLFGPMVPYLEGLNRMFRGRLTEGVRGATNNFWGFGRALQWAATIMEVVRHPLTRLVVVVGSLAAAMASLNTIQQFDRAMHRIASVAGVPARFLERVTDEIRLIGIEFGITATELNGAFERIAGAGFQGAAAFDILRAAAMGAQFGMGTVVQTQDILTSIMAVYGDEVDGAQDAIGLLLSAIREGKADADQFGASFGRVFGIARQANLSLGELLSAVTVLSRTGLPAAEGVAAVRQAIGDLTAPSRQAMTIMRDLGISVEAVQRSMGERGLVATARDLLDVLNASSWTDMQGNVLTGNQLIARIFDQVEGRNAVLQWYDSLRDATDEVMQRVGETPATLARDVWADMQDSVALAFDRFKALLHDFQIGIGGAIAAPLTGIMNFLTNNIAAIDVVLKLLFLNVVMQIVNFLLASKMVGGFFILLNRVLSGLRILGINVGAVWTGLGGLATRLRTIFSRPLNFSGIVQSLRNMVFSFNAAMLRIRAVAGQTREYMRIAMINPVLAMNMAVTAARIVGARIGNAIATGINAGFKAVRLGLTWFIGNLMDWMWTIAIFGESWDAPFQIMGETVKLASVMDGTFATLGRVFSDMWTNGVAAATEWYNSNKHYIDEFLVVVSGIWAATEPLRIALGNIFEGLFKAMPAATGVVISGFQLIWNAISETGEFFGALWRAVSGTFEAIGTMIHDVLEDLGLWDFLDDFSLFCRSVGDMFEGLGQMIQSLVTTVGIEIDRMVGEMGEKLADALTNNPIARTAMFGTSIGMMSNENFEQWMEQNGTRSEERAAARAERRRAEERARLAAALRDQGREGTDIGRIWQDAFRGVDFSETRREFSELTTAASRVGAAYREAFTNDGDAPSPDQQARGYAQLWLNNVLAAERRRREADDYVNGTSTDDRGGVPDLAFNAEDIEPPPGGGDNGRDPYADTVARLREAVDETHRMSKANDMVNAAKAAGLELQQQAVELGRLDLVSQQDLLRLAELTGLVELQHARQRELRIEDYRTATDEARRELEILRQISNPQEREAELAALRAEVQLRRDRLDITEEEIAAARAAARDGGTIARARELLLSTEQIRQETAAIQAGLSVRYENARQYAIDNALLEARNRLLAEGHDLLAADTQAYLDAVAARAAADYDRANRSLSLIETIRQRTDEAIQQMGSIQDMVGDGIMRLGDGVVDSLFSMAEAGRASFAEMTSAILMDIAKMIARMLVMKAIQSAMGFMSFSSGGVPGTTGPSPSAMGHAFDHARRFAKGSPFVNSVVSNPTLFRFGMGGSKLGLMGEAGPEAVMPLTRMPNGKLGVESMGGGGGSITNVFRPEVNINMETTGDRKMDMDIVEAAAKRFSDVMDHKMAEFEQEQRRGGHRLNGR